MIKSILTILAVLLILFFGGMETRAAKAESNQQAIPEKVDVGISYVPLPIETMFNTKNDRKINTFQRFFLATFNGGELLISAYSYTYEPIINEDKKDFEGSTVSLSFLKELFGTESISLSELYEVVFEYTNDILVYITDLNSNLVAINNDYFDSLMDNPLYSELKKIKLFEIYEFLEYFVEDASEREHILNSPNRIPVSEYLETIYKKYVPMKYWPVSFEYQKDNNINNTSNLPKLKEEILNSSFERYSLLLIFNNPNEYGEYTDPYKVSISRNYRDLEKGVWRKSDLYTDENIRTIDNSVPFLNPNEVIKEIYGVTKESNTYILNKLTIPHLVTILNKLIWEASTVREAVELYEQLPAEYQVDYSYFDFANSPNVDPAWLAVQPAFVLTPVPTPTAITTPAPTPSPYQELTLGSRGQEVLAMKQRFFELGYFSTDNYSDQFNANTMDTVRLFETNNGLPADGVADQKMLALLFSEGAVGK